MKNISDAGKTWCTKTRLALSIVAALGLQVTNACATTRTVEVCSENSIVVNGDVHLGLRPAIEAAGTDDVVDLGSLGPCTITLHAGEIATSAKNLTLQGPTGRTIVIDGNENGRILNHTSTDLGTLTINYLTLVNGTQTSSGPYGGGCIFSNGAVVADHSAFTNCSTNRSGGAIQSVKNTTLTSTVLSGNRASEGGGAVAAYRLYLNNSTISGNSGGGAFALDITAESSIVTSNTNNYASGGGLYAKFDLIATKCSISGNSTLYSGGGTFAAAIQLNDTTVSSNQSKNAGGGVYASEVFITRSTIDNNASPTSRGGGVYAGYGFVVDSTISSNKALVGAGIIIGDHSAPVTTISNTTIAYNQAGVLAGLVARGGINLTSNIIAKNIVTSGESGSEAQKDFYITPGEPATFTKNLIVASNRVSSSLTSDPKLTPLAFHGGTLRTHALLSNSPAIDKGAVVELMPNDERGAGFPRSVGIAVDIGSYEVQAIDDEIFFGGFDP